MRKVFLAAFRPHRKKSQVISHAIIANVSENRKAQDLGYPWKVKHAQNLHMWLHAASTNTGSSGQQSAQRAENHWVSLLTSLPKNMLELEPLCTLCPKDPWTCATLFKSCASRLQLVKGSGTLLQYYIWLQGNKELPLIPSNSRKEQSDCLYNSEASHRHMAVRICILETAPGSECFTLAARPTSGCGCTWLMQPCPNCPAKLMLIRVVYLAASGFSMLTKLSFWRPGLSQVQKLMWMHAYVNLSKHKCNSLPKKPIAETTWTCKYVLQDPCFTVVSSDNRPVESIEVLEIPSSYLRTGDNRKKDAQISSSKCCREYPWKVKHVQNLHIWLHAASTHTGSSGQQSAQRAEHHCLSLLTSLPKNMLELEPLCTLCPKDPWTCATLFKSCASRLQLVKGSGTLLQYYIWLQGNKELPLIPSNSRKEQSDCLYNSEASHRHMAVRICILETAPGSECFTLAARPTSGCGCTWLMQPCPNCPAKLMLIRVVYLAASGFSMLTKLSFWRPGLSQVQKLMWMHAYVNLSKHKCNSLPKKPIAETTWTCKYVLQDPCFTVVSSDNRPERCQHRPSQPLSIGPTENTNGWTQCIGKCISTAHLCARISERPTCSNEGPARFHW